MIESFRKVPGVITYSGTHRACLLRMRDGSESPRVFCSEEAREFHTDFWIQPSDIEAVFPSPFAVPGPLARKIYDAGESGMGYPFRHTSYCVRS